MTTGLIATACGFAVLATASSAQVPVNNAEKVHAAGQAMDPDQQPTGPLLQGIKALPAKG